MMRNLINALTSTVVSAFMVLSLMPTTAFAASESTEVTGKVYEFGEKDDYNYSEAESYTPTTTAATYGKFTLSGDIVKISKENDMPVYEVEGNKLSFVYSYDDTMLNADIDSWHLYEDKSKKIDGKEIGAAVQNGVILVYTSIDGMNWKEAVSIKNAFSISPVNSDSIYTAQDIELINGCYYKVVIAYGTRIRTEDSNFLFINTDKFDYRKYAEVYEFKAFTNSGEKEIIDYSQTYNLGSKVRTSEFSGYYGEKVIESNDPHYGWDLGNFFVSGYTDKRVKENGEVVFLKNVGDKVTLWFNLSQDITKLNGKDNLSITADPEGFDKYFETKKTDFGKGALIVRSTDYNNNKIEPQIYTNYLEANTSFGADTKVQLFEEGDYEVALDYEVTKDELVDTKGHYRIYFKFSVRNGNCMVYPFDLATGSELTNSSMTENGFRLDLALSRYLQINIKREVLRDSADGLVEDTRFNGPAKDGAEYTEDGIYTITVSNQYTNQSTVKKIYVGTNKVMKAYMTTGLSIPEINNLVAKGATINSDGTIRLPETETTPAETEAPPETTTTTEETTDTEKAETTETTVPATDVDAQDIPTEKAGMPPFILPAAVIIIAIAAVAAVAAKIKSNAKAVKSDSDAEKGDTE